MNIATKRIIQLLDMGLSAKLKDDGYRKKGLTFWREYKEHTRVVNVQPRTMGSDGSFAVNLGIYFPAVAKLRGLDNLWASGRGVYACVTPRGEIPTPMISQRLGYLVHGLDRWWRAPKTKANFQETNQALLEAWTHHGLSWMNRMDSAKKVQAYYESRGNAFGAGVLSLALGNRAKSILLTRKALKESPNELNAKEILKWVHKNELWQ